MVQTILCTEKCIWFLLAHPIEELATISTVVKVESMKVESLNQVTTSLGLETRQLRIYQLSIHTHMYRQLHMLCIKQATSYNFLNSSERHNVIYYKGK